MLGPSSTPVPRLPRPRTAAAAAPAQAAARRTRRGDAANNSGRPQLPPRHRESLPATPGTVGDAADVGLAVRLPNPEDARRTFEDWMKIAADNNINPANTWNLALIDYFHDMSLLKDDDNSNTINFQKASCTLDGCVKIYTSRIESVDSETRRLLDSLAVRGQKRNGEGDDGDGADGDDGEAHRRVKQERRKAGRHGARTLEDDEAELNWKHLDSEVTVDPLFKKTAAEFDEGGAHGLLLSHLMIAPNGKVLLDASDVGSRSAAAQNQHHQVSEDKTADAASSVAEIAGMNAVPDIDPAEMHAFERMFADRISMIGEMDVCPTFASFQFNSTDESSMDILARMAEQDKLASLSQQMYQSGGLGNMDLDEYMNAATEKNNAHDDEYDPFAFPADAEGGDFDLGDDDGGAGFDAYDALDDGMDEHQKLAQLARDIMLPGENLNRGAGNEGLDSMNGIGDGDNDGVEADDGPDMTPMFSHFDLDNNRNWAGPEYWRSRSLRDARKLKSGASDGSSGATTTAKKSRSSAAALNFVSGQPVDRDALLARPASGPSATLQPKSSLKSASTTSTFTSTFGNDESVAVNSSVFLPEDLHVTSECFTRFFLKPTVKVPLRKIQRRANAGGGSSAGSVTAGNNMADLFGGDMFAGGDDDDDSVGGENAGDAQTPPPFPTDDANAGGDMGFGDDGGNFDFAYGDDVDVGPLPPSQEPDPSQPTNPIELPSQASTSNFTPQASGFPGDPNSKEPPLTFARTAKRVDVRRLKENIWKAIDSDVVQAAATSAPQASETDAPKTTTLSSVVSQLSSMYSTETFQDISPAFCFICVLHLANEHGLEIHPVDPDGHEADSNVSRMRVANGCSDLLIEMP